MESRKCLHCGTEFTGKKNKKFCSDSCKVGSHLKKKDIIVQTVIEPKKKLTQDELALIYPDVPASLLSYKNSLETLKRCHIELSADKSFIVTEKALSSIRSMIDLKERTFKLRMEIYEMDQFKKENSMKVFIQEYGDKYTKLKAELDELEVEQIVRVQRGKDAMKKTTY